MGSTGSIGTSALRVIEALGEGFKVVALSAHNNVGLLAEQVGRFEPGLVAITNADKVGQFRELLPDYQGRIIGGPESLVELAELDEVEIVIAAVVGAAGLGAVLAAAGRGKRLAIANKEPLVIAGQLLMETAKRIHFCLPKTSSPIMRLGI